MSSGSARHAPTVGDHPTVSVALCTCDGEQWVAEQLRSIITQDRPPDEIVVFDDASTDSTIAVVEAVLEGTPGIDISVHRRDERLGVTANFSEALEATTGHVVFLADQDDVWRHDKIAAVLDHLRPFGDPRGAFSDARVVDGRGTATGDSLWRAHGFRASRPGSRVRLDRLVRWNVVTGATLAVNRALLDIALPIPAHVDHDAWLALIAAALGDLVALDDTLVDYRVHGRNAVGLPPSDRFELVHRRLGDDEARPRELRMFRALLERAGDQMSAQRRGDVEGKIDSLRRRLDLPSHRRQRIGGVVAGLVRRDYHRYAHGFRSAVRDLVGVS